MRSTCFPVVFHSFACGMKHFSNHCTPGHSSNPIQTRQCYSHGKLPIALSDKALTYNIPPQSTPHGEQLLWGTQGRVSEWTHQQQHTQSPLQVQVSFFVPSHKCAVHWNIDIRNHWVSSHLQAASLFHPCCIHSLKVCCYLAGNCQGAQSGLDNSGVEALGMSRVQASWLLQLEIWVMVHECINPLWIW